MSFYLKLKALCYKKLLKHYSYLTPCFNLLPLGIKVYLKKLRRQLFNLIEQEELSKPMKGKAVNYQDDTFVNICSQGLASGVNIIGCVRKIFGLAYQALSIGDSFSRSGIETCYIDCSNFSNASTFNNLAVERKILANNKYSCNIFSINPDILFPFYVKHGNAFFDNHYNIHYGAWELAVYPKEWCSISNRIHEYWAMSNFLMQSVQQALPIPVVHMPYAIDFPAPANHFDRAYYCLPKDKFLFIFSYDMSSLSFRKNPRAVLEAFKIAFPLEKDVGLVIKVSRNDDKRFLEQINELKILSSNDPRIIIIDKILPNEVMKGLINVCDCYVSLHRAEGFGMGMAEAMKMNKSVIATNYSGNTDFTTNETACMVDYKLVPIKPGEFVYYSPDQLWADPYIEHAAEHMKKLFSDQARQKKIAKAGKAFIDDNYNHQVVGARFVKRLKLLGII